MKKTMTETEMAKYIDDIGRSELFEEMKQTQRIS